MTQPSAFASSIQESFAKGIAISFFENFLVKQLALFPNPTDVCFVFNSETKKLIRVEWISRETDHLMGWFFLNEVDCLNQIQREWLEQYLSEFLLEKSFCFLRPFEFVNQEVSNNTEPFILTRRLRSK